MPRSVPEWIGKTPDADPPVSVQLRILARQTRERYAGGAQHAGCATCAVVFGGKWQPQFDHIKEIWEGGENRESNLQALCPLCHREKTDYGTTRRAKADATAARYFNLKTPSKKKQQRRKPAKRYKRKVDGTVIDLRTGQPVSR